jgi:transposase
MPPGSQIAVESVGNWYWMIDEMERAGHNPMLVHPVKAKMMMGQINKTDKLDARGLALLLRNGTLPTVWIPPGELRDKRELPRMRMCLVRMRTTLKNRIHATLSKYAVDIQKVSNIFGKTGRMLLKNRLATLPPYTFHSLRRHLEVLDQMEIHIKQYEKQIEAAIQTTPTMKQLMTLPGVGKILIVVITLEIGCMSSKASPSSNSSWCFSINNSVIPFQ